LSLKNNAALDFLVDSAAQYKFLCDGLKKNKSIPEAMRFVGCTGNDAIDRAFQMQVQRAVANQQNSLSAPNKQIFTINTATNAEQSTDLISPLSMIDASESAANLQPSRKPGPPPSKSGPKKP
jgi:hypothetical protein